MGFHGQYYIEQVTLYFGKLPDCSDIYSMTSKDARILSAPLFRTNYLDNVIAIKCFGKVVSWYPVLQLLHQTSKVTTGDEQFSYKSTFQALTSV